MEPAFYMGPEGLEPSAYGLKGRYSTVELRSREGYEAVQPRKLHPFPEQLWSQSLDLGYQMG